MTTFTVTEDVRALLTAHGTNDHDAFDLVLGRVVADAAGDPVRLARLLRTLVVVTATVFEQLPEGSRPIVFAWWIGREEAGRCGQ